MIDGLLSDRIHHVFKPSATSTAVVTRELPQVVAELDDHHRMNDKKSHLAGLHGG